MDNEELDPINTVEDNFPVKQKDFPAYDIKADVPVTNAQFPKEVNQDTGFTDEEREKLFGIKKQYAAGIPSINETGDVIGPDDSMYLQLPPVEQAPKKEKKTISIPAGGILDSELERKRKMDAGLLNMWEVEKGNEYSLFESLSGALVSGTIKIPYNLVSLGAKVLDAVGPDGIKVDEGKLAGLEKWFAKTIPGKLLQDTEEAAHSTAAGKMLEIFTELYGGGKLALGPTNKAIEIADQYVKAAKYNRLVSASTNIKKASDKAVELNKITGLTRGQKFIAVGVGGGIGAGLVVDAEDVGTFGDLFGGPTELDRNVRPLSKDDALRQLSNQFKFATESAFINVLFSYGAGKIGDILAKQGKDLTKNDILVEQWVDKFASKFRARGEKPQALFEEVQKVGGVQEAAQVTAKDLIRDIDKSLAEVTRSSRKLAQSPNIGKVVGKMDELLQSGDDVVRNGKLEFKGFDPKKFNEVQTYLKDLGVTKEQTNQLAANLFKVRDSFNNFKNQILEGKNLNIGAKQFNEIMANRANNFFSSEYRIFTDKSVIPYYNYKPSIDSINETKQVLMRNAAASGRKLTGEEADLLVNDIIKNVKLNPVTKTPEFQMTKLSALDDAQTQLVNIADNIVGKEFKPTDLIKTKKDLQAFQRLFGQKRDLRSTISNVMEDLSNIASKDAFYNNLYKLNDSLIKSGQKGIAYTDRLTAMKAFPNKQVIANKNGLQIKSPLGEEIYTNPFNRYFTIEPIAKALQFSEELPFAAASKFLPYKYLVLVPKGLTQISKTILGPFTHTRNFTTSAAFTIGTGNIFKNPQFLLKSAMRSWSTIQPQLAADSKLGKIVTLGLSYRNLPKDQAFYKFLLEENVVSTNSTFHDIKRLMADIGKGGDFLERSFGNFGKAMKKIYNVAKETYVAEDDFWKIFNFLSEHDNLRNAYTTGLKNGVIKSMPSDLVILKEAASIVRDTVPNYSRVSDFVKGSARLPLSNFVSFPAEIFRTTGNIIEQSLKEIKDPIKQSIGYRRLLGLGTVVTFLPPALVEGARALYGITRDELIAMRRFLPRFSESSTIVPSKDKKTGEYKYVDFSSSMPYGVISDPIQGVIAGMENARTNRPDDPVIKGFVDGAIRGLGKAAGPFVDESIWFTTMATLFIRDGVTSDGNRVWNEQAPLGEKISKAASYAIKQLAPGSPQQFKRLGYAITGTPGERGEQYEVPDELAGFAGMRNVKLEPLKQMDFKIAQFQDDIRNTRSLFTGETLGKGGRTDENKIIERYIIANKQKFKIMGEMKKDLDAAKTLGVKEDDIYVKFKDRGEKKAFGIMKDNEFAPIPLSKGVARKFEDETKELRSSFEDLEFPTPLNDRTIDKIIKLQDRMSRIKLDRNFDDYIKMEDYIDKRSEAPIPAPNATANLGMSPMPSPEVLKQVFTPQTVTSKTGLTSSEQAYLSQDEQTLRLKQRGLLS